MLALVGAGLVLLSTAKYGAGLSPDSVWYLEVARSLVAGRGFVNHVGAPLVMWPPLYPMLLAVIGFATRLDPAVFVRLVNAVLFVLVIYLSARLIHSGPRQSLVYSLLGVCAVLFSRTFSEVYAMAWSDCLFIPLTLLYLVSAQSYWQRRCRWSLSVMTFATALACVAKYLGIALVPAGVLTIVLASGLKFGKRVVRACVFAAISLVPIGFWMLHLLHRHHFGAAVGIHPSPTLQELSSAWAGSIASCVRIVLSWYLPWGAWFVGLVGLVAAAAATMFSPTTRSRLASGMRVTLLHYAPAVLFIATYVFVLVSALAARGGNGFVEVRYLSYVYVPVTLLLLELAARLFTPSQLLTTGFVRKVPAILLALWLCFPLESAVRSTAFRFKDGAGDYNTRKWRESKTIASAKQMLSVSDHLRVYSNRYDALWELARVDATQSPDRTVVNLRDLEGRWPAGNGALLVYFKNDTWRTYLYSVEELEQVSDMEEVADFSDGSIYRVSVRQITAHNSSQRGSVLPNQPCSGDPGRIDEVIRP
jgi:hypothetical protein